MKIGKSSFFAAVMGKSHFSSSQIIQSNRAVWTVMPTNLVKSVSWTLPTQMSILRFDFLSHSPQVLSSKIFHLFAAPFHCGKERILTASREKRAKGFFIIVKVVSWHKVVDSNKCRKPSPLFGFALPSFFMRGFPFIGKSARAREGDEAITTFKIRNSFYFNLVLFATRAQKRTGELRKGTRGCENWLFIGSVLKRSSQRGKWKQTWNLVGFSGSLGFFVGGDLIFWEEDGGSGGERGAILMEEAGRIIRGCHWGEEGQFYRRFLSASTANTQVAFKKWGASGPWTFLEGVRGETRGKDND